MRSSVGLSLAGSRSSEIAMKLGQDEAVKYFLGVDLAYQMKWWQRLLVWLRLAKRSRFQDYSYSTVFKKLSDGTLEVVDVNLF